MSDYPKMLYLGPYRTPVTVQTAEEEAAQRAAYAENATPAHEPVPERTPTSKTEPQPSADVKRGRRGVR